VRPVGSVTQTTPLCREQAPPLCSVNSNCTGSPPATGTRSGGIVPDELRSEWWSSANCSSGGPGITSQQRHTPTSARRERVAHSRPLVERHLVSRTFRGWTWLPARCMKLRQSKRRPRSGPGAPSVTDESMHTWLILIGSGGLPLALVLRPGGSDGPARIPLLRQEPGARGDAETVTFEDVAGVDEAKEELQEVVDFLSSPGRYLSIGAHIPRACCWWARRAPAKRCWRGPVAGEAKRPFYQPVRLGLSWRCSSALGGAGARPVPEGRAATRPASSSSTS